jgi:hypothetical protein
MSSDLTCFKQHSIRYVNVTNPMIATELTWRANQPARRHDLRTHNDKD